MDPQLSHLSDLALDGAMAGYVVALVCHAVETASHRVRRDALANGSHIHSDHSGLDELGGDVAGGLGSGQLAVAAVGGSVTTLTRSGIGVGDGPATGHAAGGSGTGRSGPVPMGERFGRAAVAVTIVGFACHVLALVLRGVAAGRPPWGNMYEFTMMITGAAVAAWLVVLWRSKARLMGIYVMFPVTVLVFLAGTVLYTQTAPLLPVLNSYWLIIHVAAISLSSGVLMLAGVASAAYLVRDRRDRRVAAGILTEDEAPTRLPSRDKLDRIAYRSAIAAFPFYTFAIMAGAMWAEVAWGSYWSWDPKETVALVSWVVYAGYLHARATAGWRGRPAAWICVVGLATIIFNLFFVNMVISGLHSYAGLN